MLWALSSCLSGGWNHDYEHADWEMTETERWGHRQSEKGRKGGARGRGERRMQQLGFHQQRYCSKVYSMPVNFQRTETGRVSHWGGREGECNKEGQKESLTKRGKWKRFAFANLQESIYIVSPSFQSIGVGCATPQPYPCQFFKF